MCLWLHYPHAQEHPPWSPPTSRLEAAPSLALCFSNERLFLQHVSLSCWFDAIEKLLLKIKMWIFGLTAKKQYLLSECLEPFDTVLSQCLDELVRSALQGTYLPDKVDVKSHFFNVIFFPFWFTVPNKFCSGIRLAYP